MTIFVTGAQRSGTTLLDRRLAAHPAISMLSQPAPLWFVAVKSAFLDRLGGAQVGEGEVARRYPLGSPATLAGDDEAFTRFLHESWRASSAELRSIFRSMEGFSGQYQRLEPSVLDDFCAWAQGRDFAAVHAGLCSRFANRTGALRHGSKEVTCEEFVPYLLARSVACAIVVREPWDVVASLNHGDGRLHGGLLKPVLFILRQWRRSVEAARRHLGREGFLLVGFRDLVEWRRETQAEVGRWAGVEELPFGEDAALRAPQGGEWTANSSFDDPAARESVPSTVRRFIEAACYWELRALAMPCGISRREARLELSRFADPYPLERPELAAFADPAFWRATELERWDRLEAESA